MNKKASSDQIKLGLAIFWLLFTASMVAWWWIFSLRQLNELSQLLPDFKYERVHRMLWWEGSVLLAFVIIAGSALLILVHREHRRNQGLRLFFSNFSHDLKTSLSRLRLRAEVLSDRVKDPAVQNLMEEVHRLDIQLENSLWVARGEQGLHLQDLSLSSVVSSLRVEWPNLEIQLDKEAKVHADWQAFRSVLRNLFQNSWLHGQASRVDIHIEKKSVQEIEICLLDNGVGLSQDKLAELGRHFLPSQKDQSNGLGLYLTRSLLKKMSGDIAFEESQSGFKVRMKIKGDLENSL